MTNSSSRTGSPGAGETEATASVAASWAGSSTRNVLRAPAPAGG
ncbi:MAG: hypothetical protein ABIP29_07795 [Candidatus Eisenbacteria bacterium]